MHNDTIGKTVGVAAAVCVICSIFVSGAAVYLKPIQEANKTLDVKRNILIAAGLLEEGRKADIGELFTRIDSAVVDLATGEFVDDITPEQFDPRKAAKAPSQSVAIDSQDDIAGIKRRSNYRVVYFLKDGEKINRLILPMYGKGLWSTMYGFLALGADMTTIKSFGFYEHAETPGLGGEIDNPAWKALWVGKIALDADRQPAVRVIRGHVDENSPEAVHQVDGLSGATITGRGVENLVRFWLGREGYGPLLEKLIQ